MVDVYRCVFHIHVGFHESARVLSSKAQFIRGSKVKYLGLCIWFAVCGGVSGGIHPSLHRIRSESAVYNLKRRAQSDYPDSRIITEHAACGVIRRQDSR